MSTTTDSRNRAKRIAGEEKLVDGLDKHGQLLGTLRIGGVAYAPADIVAILQTRLAAYRTVQTAAPAWHAAVQAEKDQRARTRAFVSGFRQALLVAFEGSIDALADFGLTPRKPRVVSPGTKAAAAVKAKATRTARHTMGKKQKENIKGAVPTTGPGGPHVP
jgi:hypothetical protein